MSSPFTLGTRILAAGALAFALLLGGGFVLPGTWQAERSASIAAEAERLLPYLDSPSGWREWTPWPEVGIESEGPERGAGARIAWNHPEVGQGAFHILDVQGTSRVVYRVDVEEGAMVTVGSLELVPGAAGTQVTWREEGDFGWNPLMGYWALAMGRVQGREMEKGLERLRQLVEGS